MKPDFYSSLPVHDETLPSSGDCDDSTAQRYRVLLQTRSTAKGILDSLTGYWEIIERSDPAITATYFLDVRANGKCKTNFGARFVDEPSDGFDRIEVITDSSFALAITQGENYVFAVTRFDGDEMDVLLGGWKECPLSLTRTPHPSRLNPAEP